MGILSKTIYKRSLLLATLLSISLYSFSQSNWDTIYLKNGQTIFGTLKSISLGKISFDAEDLTVINIKNTKIKTIEASKRYYRMETVKHKEFFGILKKSEKDGFVNISTPGEDQQYPMALSDISALNYYSAKNSIWEGNISAGYTFTKSSQIGRLNFDASFRCLMKKGEYSVVASSIITQEGGDWIRDRENLMLNRDYFLNALWKMGVLLNYQRNLELGLARRYQEGFGIGYTWLTNSSMKGDITSGLIVNQEKSIPDDGNVFTAELPFKVNYNFYRFQHPKLTLNTNQSVYVSLTQKGRIRHDGEIRIDWEMIKDFSISAKFYNSFDSKPASGMGKNFDYGIVFGLTYTFD